MAQKMKWKVKVYTWLSYLKDKLNPTRYYKPALVTPPVIVGDKFLQNVANETGLSIYQAKAVLSSIVRTAGDYLEAGNSVQLDEDFGTIKPFLKVKGTEVLNECNSSAIIGVGIKFIPTGKMKQLLGDVQFQFVGTTENSGEVEDSEVVNPGDGGGDENGDANGDENPTYTISVKASPSNGGTVSGGGEFASGAQTTLTASAKSGYTFKKWSDGDTNATRTVTVTENKTYTAQFGSVGDDDENNI